MVQERPTKTKRVTMNIGVDHDTAQKLRAFVNPDGYGRLMSQERVLALMVNFFVNADEVTKFVMMRLYPETMREQYATALESLASRVRSGELETAGRQPNNHGAQEMDEQPIPSAPRATAAHRAKPRRP